MSTQVKGWILEYSIKHNLVNLVEQFEHKHGPVPAQLQNVPLAAHEPNLAECLPPSYLLLWFVYRAFKRLENPSQFEKVEKLQYLLMVLRKLYVWSGTVPLNTFWPLHTMVKVMVLLQSLRRKSMTAQQFNDYFPPWSSDYEEKLSSEYAIKTKTELELIREDHESCRLFIFSLMLSKVNIAAFYKKFLIHEFENYVENFKRLLTIFVEDVVSVLPDTKIEGVLQGGVSKELSNSRNPAVHILLEALRSCTDERRSVENALRKALLALNSMTVDHSKTSTHFSQKISPDLTDLASEKSPAHSVEHQWQPSNSTNNVSKTNGESHIAAPVRQNEMVQASSAQYDEPVPSTSTGITHENGKMRDMRTLLRRKQRDNRRRIFKNSSRYLFFSSEDDSS